MVCLDIIRVHAFCTNFLPLLHVLGWSPVFQKNERYWISPGRGTSLSPVNESPHASSANQLAASYGNRAPRPGRGHLAWFIRSIWSSSWLFFFLQHCRELFLTKLTGNETFASLKLTENSFCAGQIALVKGKLISLSCCPWLNARSVIAEERVL